MSKKVQKFCFGKWSNYAPLERSRQSEWEYVVLEVLSWHICEISVKNSVFEVPEKSNDIFNPVFPWNLDQIYFSTHIYILNLMLNSKYFFKLNFHFSFSRYSNFSQRCQENTQTSKPVKLILDIGHLFYCIKMTE